MRSEGAFCGVALAFVTVALACTTEEHTRATGATPTVSTPAAPSPSAAPPRPDATVAWVPPECGPGITHYMVDCDPRDPTCGPQGMRPVACPPR